MTTRIDILNAFGQEPPPLDFVWPGFLAGTVGALVAPGSSGKSFWALQAAMAVATGGEVDSLGIRPEHAGLTWYVGLEDPAAIIQRRLHAMGSRLDMHQRQQVAENLMIDVLHGQGLDLMHVEHKKRLIAAGEGCRLIIVDTLSRAHQLDENSNGDMARLVASLEGIAATTGAAVLVLHHVSKAAALAGQGGQQQAARGASALVDNMRFVGALQTMSEDESEKLKATPAASGPIGSERTKYVRYQAAKQNYGQIEGEQWYRRGEGGVLYQAEVYPVKKGGGRDGI